MKSVCVTLGLTLALCAVSAAATVQITDAKAGKAVTPQTTCPVMGDKIDRSQYADYQGKRVYFCCPDCKATFDKDPAKYVKKLEDSGVTLEKTPVPQTTCPVLGNKIDKSLYADYKGKRVYFCCAGCKDDFDKDPEKYIKKLEDAGVTVEKTPVPQTACPVLDGKINKDLYADYQGKRVYFCCTGCKDDFNKDPEKYIKKLEDAGITLEKTPEAAKPGKAPATMDHSSAAGHGGATSAKPK